MTETAPCDECEHGTVRPFADGLEYVCDRCDANMSSSRFSSAKDF